MPRYALVMTADERLLPGVHGMLNAMKYYGTHDLVEHHFLYWPSSNTERFVSDMARSEQFPNFRPVNLREYALKNTGKVLQHRPVYYLKFYRSLYASRLIDYDAVGFMDADMAIVGDIVPYFRLADLSGHICMIEWAYNQNRVDSGWYAKYKIHATSGCPYDPCATFFAPKTWGKHFEKVHRIGLEIGRSEMPTMNYMLITENLLNKVIRLSQMRWTERKWGSLATEWKKIGDWYRLMVTRPSVKDDPERFILKCGEELPGAALYVTQEEIGLGIFNSILSIHGRWHFRQTLERKPCQGKNLERHNALVQNQNIANIWEIFKFFNFKCYTRLDPWMPEWGDEDEYIDVETGLLKRAEK